MPCVFTVQVVRSSHAFHLFLYSFPSFVHNIDQVGIHQVDDKICSQDGEQCQQKDTHEKVSIKGRPPPKYKELRGELVLVTEECIVCI